MAITKKELQKLVAINVDIEKTSSISSDGKNFLFRIPKEIVDFLDIQKEHKIKWHVTHNKKITLTIQR